MEAHLLHCPIRGRLEVPQRAQDGLRYTEEKRRIDAIRFLLQRDYPKSHFGVERTLLRFGHGGRNSFRIDFSVYSEPWSEIRRRPIEDRLQYTRLVAEIKRDNADAKQAIETQVKPALGFLPDLSAIGVYWDDVEQRFFYRSLKGTRTELREAPINKIPRWREAVGSTQLTYSDLDASRNLSAIFDKLEDGLHPYLTDKSKRYSVLFQLLLAKIWDETTHRSSLDSPLEFQDYSAVGDGVVVKRMNKCLCNAVEHYNRYLPEQVGKTFGVIAPEALRRLSQVLSPVNVLASRQKVIQDFYMRFARDLYRWDLAQFFTPHEVVKFIVDLTNPQLEHVVDPACGSADFLVSALQSMPTAVGTAAEFVSGRDNSSKAVQVAVLNMMLNGDGKTAIQEIDSLQHRSDTLHDVVLCNPPFGTKILEKRSHVLQRFAMGHRWKREKDRSLTQTRAVRGSQQTGILFAELCVRLCRLGGRVGIILPNGYLGNAKVEYAGLREWLFRNTRLVAVIGFPRFTFKKSGGRCECVGRRLGTSEGCPRLISGFGGLPDLLWHDRVCRLEGR